MKYSVVIPLYNEEESIKELYKNLKKVMDKVAFDDYEILYINDGSTDNSLSAIKSIIKKNPNVRVISLRKNSGKSVGLTIAFNEIKGERVITMDADLQDIPSEIPKLIKKMDEGFDMVSGWKKDRKDPWEKKFFSKIFNGLLSFFSGVKFHDFNCGFKIYKKDVVKELILYGDLYRVIPFLVVSNGFRATEIAVNHNPRKYGKSKYTFLNRLPGALDILTSVFLSKFADRPFHFFGICGGIVFVVGLGILMYLFGIHILGIPVGRRPLLLYGGIILLAGLQIVLTGLVAELIIRSNQKKNIYNKYSILKD